MTRPLEPDTALSIAQRAVATFGLPVTVGRDADDDRVTDQLQLDIDDLDELASWAERERLDGLLWRAVASGHIVATSGANRTAGTHRTVENEHGDQPEPSRVEAAHLRGLRSSLAAEATAVTAVAALQQAGIETLLFKGLANAHLDYERPEDRTFFDADLLVARADLTPAIDTLVASGFSRATPPLRNRWEQRFARAVELRSPQGVEVDLHASLVTGYFGATLVHDALRQETAVVRLAGADHRAFGPAVRLLISSYAVVLSRGPGVRLVRDLAQQLLVTGADWRRAADLAGDGDVVLASGLLQVARRFGVEHDAVDWARTVTASPTAERALALAHDAHRVGWSADARSTMLALGPAARIRYLAGIALPARANLRARGRTITSHLRPGRSSTRSPDQPLDHER